MNLTPRDRAFVIEYNLRFRGEEFFLQTLGGKHLRSSLAEKFHVTTTPLTDKGIFKRLLSQSFLEKTSKGYRLTTAGVALANDKD